MLNKLLIENNDINIDWKNIEYLNKVYIKSEKYSC